MQAKLYTMSQKIYEDKSGFKIAVGYRIHPCQNDQKRVYSYHSADLSAV